MDCRIRGRWKTHSKRENRRTDRKMGYRQVGPRQWQIKIKREIEAFRIIWRLAVEQKSKRFRAIASSFWRNPNAQKSDMKSIKKNSRPRLQKPVKRISRRLSVFLSNSLESVSVCLSPHLCVCERERGVISVALMKRMKRRSGRGGGAKLSAVDSLSTKSLTLPSAVDALSTLAS